MDESDDEDSENEFTFFDFNDKTKKNPRENYIDEANNAATKLKTKSND
jgi:hypothetical protein